MEISVKNKIFHTQDLYLRTNLRCAKNSARTEIIMSEKVSIGILAVQGAFAEHQAMLDGLGAGFGRGCAEWRTAGDRASRR